MERTDKMPHRYELHCHTAEGSKCSTVPAVDLIEMYKRNGYSGVFITDHFSGMTTVPNETSWEDRVGFWYGIHTKAKQAGDKAGISVFPGMEYSPVPDVKHFTGGSGADFIILNISREWLLDNRDAFSGSSRDQLKKIRDAGGFVIHAHPFKEASYIEYMKLIPRSVDAVEVINAGCNDSENNNALGYARAYGLLEAAGSDCHNISRTVFAGLETEFLCRTPEDLVNAIINKKAKPFRTVKEE
jgi:hypothetical protein